MLAEGAMFALSLMPIREANQYELKLIALLRKVIDSKGFKYFLESLAKNPNSKELKSGFDEQITLCHACLEMIVPQASQTMRVLLYGIVSDEIRKAIPAKGSEERWREVVDGAQKSLEIKTAG